jgi:6-phosphogluconolactonase (cycloisomerase 2 family)
VVSSPVIATTEKALVVRSSSGAGTNQTAQIISYAVDANGGLSRQSSTTIQNIGPMAADARFVYVATVAGIFAFDNKEGKLQAVAGSPYNLEPQVCTLCTDLGPDSLALTAGKAFSAEQTDRDASSLTSFNRAPDGSLNGAVESGSASQDSLQVAVTPDGRFLYVITDLGQVACYSANPDGSLTLATGPAEDDTEASYINVTGDGKYLLVSTLTGTIRTFRINSESGATTEIASSPFITGESSTGHTALDPGGRIVVVANGDPFLGPEPTNFMVLARDPGSGALSKTGSVSLSGVTQLLIGTFPFEH